MARTRAANSGQDSFDLFLDAITNTFGVVLLIALMIVLLIKPQVQSKSSASSSASAGIVEADIENLELKISAAKSELALVDDQLVDFSGDKQKELLEQLVVVSNAESEAKIESSSLSGELKQIEKEISEQERASIATRKQAKELEQQISSIGEKIDRQRENRTRELPMMKPASRNKVQIPVLIKGGKAYFTFSQTRRGVNNEFFERAVLGSDLHYRGSNYRIKPQAGLSAKEFGVRLKKYSFHNRFLGFVIRTDSFADFNGFGNEAIGQGFRLELLPQDSKVTFGSNVSSQTQ